MANASELLHFIKQDRDLSGMTADAQDTLAEAVQHAFRFLVNCMHAELNLHLPSILGWLHIWELRTIFVCFITHLLFILIGLICIIPFL